MMWRTLSEILFAKRPIFSGSTKFKKGETEQETARSGFRIDGRLSRRVLAYCQAIFGGTDGMDVPHFFFLHAEAVGRRLTNLGEKTKALSSDIRKTNPSISLKFWDRISHQYEGIDEKTVF